jgi:phage shock protein C
VRCPGRKSGCQLRAFTEARENGATDAGYVTQMPSYKQLRRSRTDRKIAGVCGGLARYFNIDPTAVRVAFVLLVIITGGVAVIGYLAAWLLMPEESFDSSAAQGYFPPQPPRQPPAA